MDIKYNQWKKEYMLGNISYSKQEFISYIESDMLMNVLTNEKSSIDSENNIDFDKKYLHNNPQLGGENWIYYGAPGCGKSHKVKKDLDDSGVEENNIFRITFHPEYTNSDFVGQIMPTIHKDEDNRDVVEYIFNPGPFTKALERALTVNEPVYLVIEEINRGNAAAIFGDIFQLLDRQKAELENGDKNLEYGRSEYEINNPNIEDYLKSKIDLADGFKVYIPRNMFIWATMNSSDQNVFTLDTAFKRRWNFEQIPNDISSDSKHKYKNWKIPGTNVSWETFLSKLNPAILDYKIKNHTNEDKQLGKYFVGKECLTENLTPILECQSEANQFAYKVLEYLWNDVCKIDKDVWFDTAKYRTLEELIKGFISPQANQSPLAIFKNIEF